MARVSVARVLGVLVACGLAAVAPVGATTSPIPPPLPPPSAEEVRVESVKPTRPKLATLRFLKENRDFLRGRLDLLRQQAIERPGEAAAIDPRFLAYARLKEEILAGGDSLAAGRDALARHALFERIADLSALEDELDRMELLLAGQRERLSVLEADFTGRQATALLVVLRGAPPALDLAEVTIELEDGAIHRVPLSAAERDALARGGMAQALHVFVEPRAQSLAITLRGAAGPGTPAYLPLEPARDRLSFVELDLSRVGPAADATALTARTWLHQPAVLAGAR